MADTSEPTHVTRQQGQSVASFWGEALAAAARGEDIELADKHGEVIAMMVSKKRYDQLAALDQHSHLWTGSSDQTQEEARRNRCSCGLSYGEYLDAR